MVVALAGNKADLEDKRSVTVEVSYVVLYSLIILLLYIQVAVFISLFVMLPLIADFGCGYIDIFDCLSVGCFGYMLITVQCYFWMVHVTEL